MVFGPSAEKRAIANSAVVREFPKCPICKTASGYQVSGSSLEFFQCNGCWAKWQSEPLSGGRIVSMTLVQPSGHDFRGIELTGVRYEAGFYKNFDASFGWYLKNYRSHLATQLGSNVSMEIGEEVVWAWGGSRITRVPSPLGSLASQAGISQIAEHAGQLYLTSERLVWVQDGLFNFEVSLQDLASFSPITPTNNASYVVLKSRGNVEGWFKLWLWYGTVGNVEVAKDNRAFERVRGMIFRQQQMKRERIQKEKQREQVQVVLDFSSIKETLARGGVVVTTFKCPQCSAPLEIPDTGQQVKCGHCGATIRPVDLFDKIKSLMS